jgi:hypothetical protein
VDAEQQRDHRHHQQRQHAGLDVVRVQELAAEPDHHQQPGQVEPVPAGSSSGLPPILPDSLPKAMIEPLKVTAPIRMPT